MNAELVHELEAPRTGSVSARARAIRLLGPVTAVAGLAWAVAQPYRVTLLHPHGETFWWLFVEPPLLVLLVGVLFHVLVTPGLVDDLEAEDAAAR